jgi:DNA polymerase
MKELELDISKLHFTNIVKCPHEINRPALKTIKNCKPYLFKQIAIVQPTVVLLLGKTAANNLTNSISVVDDCGRVHKTYDMSTNSHVNWIVCPHPSYLMRLEHRSKNELLDKIRVSLAEVMP